MDMEDILEDLLKRSAKSSGPWIKETADLLDQIAADPNNLHKYFKIKCLAASRKSSLFRGLVFTKAPAHEEMPKTCEKPELLMWEGSLDGDPNDSASQRRIEDSQANVILVENSVSPNCFLLRELQVTVVADMKHRLHRFPTRLSTCESFNCLEVTEDLSHGKPVKRLMYFGGCQSFTILLSGTDTYELKAMKGILQSGFNRLRNKLLPSSVSYLVALPPSIIQPPEAVDGREEEEVLVREEEISTYIALALQQSERKISPNPNLVSFQEPQRFHQLRTKFNIPEAQFIKSLSRCDPWEAKGGKSGAVFSKTSDKRFIIKEIKQTEFDSFGCFSTRYFDYLMSEEPKKTCLAKIFGIYEVTLRSKPRFLMVMENLLFNRGEALELYDLKGKTHDRLTDSDQVFQDQNFVNNMKTSPLPISHNSKLNFELAIQNDASFLSSVKVMDYSLLVGVDREIHEIVCGIIDYLAPYSWIKRLESGLKYLPLLCTDLKPTVIPPHQYKKRFIDFINSQLLVETSLRDRGEAKKQSREGTSGEKEFEQKLETAAAENPDELDHFTWS